MWYRVALGAVAFAGGLAVTGVAPGDSTRVTVEHCYTYYGPQEVRSTSCTGRWSRFGVAFTGDVHGVDVRSDWQVIPPYPRPDGGIEVTVPDSAAVRVRPAAAVPGAATVTPWIVWTARVALAIEAVAWIALLVHLVRSRLHLVRSRRRARVPSRG